MGQLTIKYANEQMKAMEHVALDPKEWIQNAWDNRARQAIDEIVQKYSDYQPKKISLEKKTEIVGKARIETARQRQKRFEKDTGTK